MGLIKGKSDPLDSKRTREYGERFTVKLEYAEYPEENITELKQLYTLRHQLYTLRHQLEKQRKTLRTIDKGRGVLPMQSIDVHNHINNVLAEPDKEIDSIEDEIETLIMADQEMNENYELVTGIKGIGPVIATDLIIKTGSFKTKDTLQNGQLQNQRYTSKRATSKPKIHSEGRLLMPDYTLPQYFRYDVWEIENKPRRR